MAQSPGCLSVPNKAVPRKVKYLTPEQNRELVVGGRAQDTRVGTKGLWPRLKGETLWVQLSVS